MRPAITSAVHSEAPLGVVLEVVDAGQIAKLVLFHTGDQTIITTITTIAIINGGRSRLVLLLPGSLVVVVIQLQQRLAVLLEAVVLDTHLVVAGHHGTTALLWGDRYAGDVVLKELVAEQNAVKGEATGLLAVQVEVVLSKPDLLVRAVGE